MRPQSLLPSLRRFTTPRAQANIITRYQQAQQTRCLPGDSLTCAFAPGYPPSGMPSKIPRSIRWFCAAALAGLLVASPGLAEAAGESARLEDVKKELAVIRKRLDAAKGEARTVRAQVSALDKQIAGLNNDINAGEREIAGLESEIRSAEAKIAELEERHRRAAEASSVRARSIYKAGPTSILANVFNLESMGELVRLSLWWEVAAEMDGKIMLQAARLKADLADYKEDLGRVRADLAERKSLLEQRRALVAGARGDRASALKSIEQEIAAQEAHLKALERESRALTAALRGSLSRSSGAVSRSGFIWPLNGRVTSGYGYRRGGFHSGIDIDGNTGDRIVASKAGVIVGINCGSGYGICTIIDHGDGVATLYAHMSRKAVAGGHVERGQVIGYVGCTGHCYGSHLHFEVRVNGEPRNPMNFLP